VLFRSIVLKVRGAMVAISSIGVMQKRSGEYRSHQIHIFDASESRTSIAMFPSVQEENAFIFKVLADIISSPSVG
jgi:hypothetical protein